MKGNEFVLPEENEPWHPSTLFAGRKQNTEGAQFDSLSLKKNMIILHPVLS